MDRVVIDIGSTERIAKLTSVARVKSSEGLCFQTTSDFQRLQNCGKEWLGVEYWWNAGYKVWFIWNSDNLAKIPLHRQDNHTDHIEALACCFWSPCFIEGLAVGLVPFCLLLRQYVLSERQYFRFRWQKLVCELHARNAHRKRLGLTGI